MKKALSVALILVVLVTALASCGVPVEEKLVGKWTYNETILGIVTEKTFVFNADGTGTAPGDITGDLIPLEMKWTVTEDIITVTKNVSNDPISYKFVLKGDTLTLTKADGTILTLTRAVAPVVAQ